MNIDSKIIDHGGRFPKLNKLAERLNIKELLLRFLPYQPFPEYDKIYSDAWLIMKNIIKMWNEDSKKYFSIFLIPPYQYIEKFSNSKNYINRFDELRLDYDINVVNPLPDLWNYSQSERRHFRFQKDAHLNRDGHIALSKVFKKMIKDL